MRWSASACGSARLTAIILTMVAAVVALMPVPIAGQAQTATANTWTPLQTPWGDPDLQGVWDYWTFTPLQRPDQFAGKDSLTDEEAALVAERGRAAAIATDEKDIHDIQCVETPHD